MTPTAEGKKVILDLCGGTGSWSNPYKEAGYDVRLITLPDYDVRLWNGYIGLDIYGIFSAPPCTEFSFAKHLQGKGRYTHDFQKGLEIVSACMRIILMSSPEFWALENPRGYLKRWLGDAPLTFNPFDYGDPYRKKTDIWGRFNLPEKHPIDAPKVKFSRLRSRDIHPEYYGLLSRQERRAITPPGFARAFFEANR